MIKAGLWLLLTLLLVFSAFAQTTMGVIRGSVANAVDGKPVTSPVQVVCNTEFGPEFARTTADALGGYLFPLVPPGVYQLHVQATSYQDLEVHNLIVPVSGTVEQNFRMRPLTDLFEQGFARRIFLPDTKNVVRFYGPDLDLSRKAFVLRWESDIHLFEPSISNVVDPQPIENLPLPGRDVYTMLLTQSAVTSDSGTQRSLGLSAGGQRPSSSNFLVDGIELNNSLIAGPAIALPPEAIQEYRVSVNGYSAEFGRTAGFLANVVTRGGGMTWHGTGYGYLRNEWLNANDFQNNLHGLSRPRSREQQLGYQTGGGLWNNRLHLSSAFEYLANASRQPAQDYVVPGAGFFMFLSSLPSGNLARQLLAAYPPPVSTPIEGEPFAGNARLEKPVTNNRYIGIQRLDSAAGSKRRIMARVIVSHFDWPDFIWSPYRDFTSGLRQPTLSAGAALISTVTPHLTHELRVGSNVQTVAWDRAHSEIPTLTVSFGNPNALHAVLPGSPAAYSYRNYIRSNELDSNLLWWHGKHLVKFGVSVFLRRTDDALPYASSGRYDFPSLPDFANASRMRLFTSLDRVRFAAGESVLPDLSRSYRNRQLSAFLQDSIRLTPRTTLNIGVRYDYFGSPVNLSRAEQLAFSFGGGDTLAVRLASGRSGVANVYSHSVYPSDPTNVGVRLGFARDLGGTSSRGIRPVLRGGYGVFFDQTFDNVWLNARNNSFVFPANGFSLPLRTNYLMPVSRVIAANPPVDSVADFPALTVFDPHLGSGAVHQYFLGIQVQLNPNAVAEISGIGAAGRNLLSADMINRQFSVPTNLTSQGGCDYSRYQPCLPDMVYFASQGWSSYHALSASVRFHGRYGFVSATYTLGHAIDVQSDPLKGDFFDLTFASSVAPGGFSSQFDTTGDRGNADFDQRQNLVFYSVWNLPAPARLRRLFGGWKAAQIAAFRSGFPFTVTDQSDTPYSGGTLLTRRADLIVPQNAWLATAVPAQGGKLLMDSSAFCVPSVCTADRSRQGNTGRNAFEGPGLYNVDVSVSRRFLIPGSREGMGLILRADAFNSFNHANLGPPATDVSSPGFGVALFGRQLRDIGLPALLPLREAARQIQIQVRLEF